MTKFVFRLSRKEWVNITNGAIVIYLPGRK